MKHDNASGASIGESQALRRQRRVWQAMLLPGAIAIGLLFAIKSALGGVTVATSPTFAVITAALIALFTLVGSIWHHRVIDEHEERAILWANTVGFYVMIPVMFGATLLNLAGLIPPQSPVTLMLIALVPAVAAYLWVRFR